jgi:hypothetical protein
MIRIKQFALSDILPFIGEPYHIFRAKGQRYRVKMRDSRMMLFSESQFCAACFVKGDHFWLEHSGCFPPHFNLYAINHCGHPVMLTLDHIIPRSRGGTKHPSNIQLLCTRCNQVKKNNPLSVEEIRKRRCSGDKGLMRFVEREYALRSGTDVSVANGPLAGEGQSV